ncbi:MAG: tRNA pseudouridine(38-40) synthase TruA [Erysipelotrichaceae bacterium]
MRVKVIVAYDGSAYHGWQTQPYANSVQAEIEQALTKMHGVPVGIEGSGRTDAKVHAKGQVFHFDTTLNISEEGWPRALNTHLPSDIRAQSAQLVDEDFHARYHAIGKRYDYLMTTHVEDPFIQKYMAKLRMPVDIERMRACAALFVGTHNFNAFTSAKVEPQKERVKTIYSIQVVEETNCIRISYYGKGFLRYQVRMMSQTIIMCGMGKVSLERARGMIEQATKEACPYNADPCGLYLMKVVYEEEEHENELSYTYPTL